MDKEEKWREVLEVQKLVKDGYAVKAALKIVSESSERSLAAIEVQYDRRKGPLLKADPYRTLKVLSLDEEELIVGYFHSMSTMDAGRTIDDTIEFARCVAQKSIDCKVVGRLAIAAPT